MLQTLFFTQINLMVPKEAGAYLSCVSVLKTEKSADRAKSLAIRQIMAQSDQNLAIYVMPQLVSVALSDAEESKADAIQLLEALCEKTSYAAKLVSVLDNSEALLAQLRTCTVQSDCVQLEAEDYIDLSQRIDTIITLSVLGALSDADVSAILDEETVMVLLQNAMQGLCGRYAFVLAYEIAEAHRLKFQPFPVQPFSCRMEPDLTAAYLRWKNVGKTAMTMLDDVFQVGRTLAEQYDVPYFNTNEKCWFSQGAKEFNIAAGRSFIDTMWTDTMLQIAYQKAQREGTTVEFTEKCCCYWKQMRDSNSKHTLSRSPWMQQKGHGTYPVFALFDVIRAVFAIPLLRQLIADAGETIPDFLAELTMNFADSIGGAFFSHMKTQARKRQNLFSDSLTAFCIFAFDLSHELLKGYWNSALPKTCCELVLRKTLPVLRGEATAYSRQERMLYSGSALMLCIKIAYEEGTGSLPICAENLIWLRGDKESMAYQLCQMAFSDYITYQKSKAAAQETSAVVVIPSAVVALAYERFPELLEELNWTLDTDWLGDYCRDGKSPDEYKLFLKKYNAGDYVSAEIIVPYPLHAEHAKKMEMLCKKVSAIAEDEYNEITEADIAVLQNFGMALLSIYNKIDFPRRVRTMAAETFGKLMDSGFLKRMVDFSGNDPTNRELNALDYAQIAEEAVTDMSREAVYYQYRVGRELLQMMEEERLNQGNAEYLICCFFNLLLYQQNMEDPRLKEMLPPFECQEILAADVVRQQLCIWFIGQLDRQGNLRSLSASLKRMLISWYHRNPQYQKLSLSIQQDGVHTDNAQTVSEEFPLSFWDPNTCMAWKLRHQPIQESFFAERLDDVSWQPMIRGFEDFIMSTLPVRASGTLRMTVISKDETAVLVSVWSGWNYRIPAPYFSAESWEKLCEEQQRIAETYDTSVTGLCLSVRLDTETQPMPQLCILETDDKNLRYANLFSETDSIPWDVEQPQKVLQLDGFRVTAKPHGTRKSADMKPTPDGWTVRQQRLQVLLLEPDATRSLKECRETQDLQQLLSMQTEQIVQLNQITYKKENAGNYNMAFTNFGMPVRLQADSFSLAAPMRTGICSYQLAVITMIPSNDYVPNGVIWKYKSDGDAVIQYQGKDHQTETIYVPVDELNVSARSIYCGLPVWVDADSRTVKIAQRTRKSRNGTAEKPSVSMMNVRRLWKVEHRKGAAVCSEDMAYIGAYQLPECDAPSYLVQDYQRGILYAYEQEIEQHPDTVCGVDLRRGKAFVHKEKWDENIIAFQVNERICYGYAKKTEGFTEKPVRCGKVSVSLIPYSVEGAVWYDVKRIFSKPERAENKSAATPHFSEEVLQKQRAAKLYSDEFLEWQMSARWIIGNVRHAEGVAVRDADDRFWFVPKSPLRAFPVSSTECSAVDPSLWTTRIPMQLARTFALEPQTKVFAKIAVGADGSYIAFPEESVPFTPERFFDWMTRKYPNVREYNDTLRFITSRTEEETGECILTFELLFGLRIEFSESALELIGERSITPTHILFYGDWLSSYRLLRDADTGKVRLSAKLEALHLSIEHRVRDDASSGIVQYLKLRYNKERDEIRTEKISVRSNALGMESPVHFKPYLTGGLDEETAAYVKEKLADGGEGILAVRPADTFDGISMRQFFTRLPLSEINEKILCMRGGTITETFSGNDYYVEFAMPQLLEEGQLLDTEFEDFTAVVRRRGFSYLESTLRMQYRTENKNVFCSDMLVRVLDIEKRDFSVKAVPAHKYEHTKKWLEMFGAQHVIIGTKEYVDTDWLVRCEISPGVICHAIPVQNAAHPCTLGSRGRMYLANNRIYVEQISDDDSSFVKDGRPSELLIMDHTRHNRGNSSVHFTIAGLPQVLAEGNSLYQYLVKHNPPRFGVLHKDAANNVHAEFATLQIGYLKAENNGRIKQYGKNLPNPLNRFHVLTFLDGSMQELWKHIQSSSWHYHDKQTFVLKQGEESQIVAYKSGQELPLIYTSDYRLRYTEEEIDSYAFPPHELEEYGIPDDSAEYPVAYSFGSGFYMELSPGRILKLNSRMLHIAKMGRESETLKFNAEYLHTGDMVRLRTVTAKHGAPRSIVLESVRYSLRDYILPNHNAFLPIADVPNRTVLGNNTFSLTYPTIQRYTVGETVMLNPQNEICPCDTMPAIDDTIMLYLDENDTVRAYGFEEMQVSVTIQNPNGKTLDFLPLYKQLQNPAERKQLFEAIGGMLPVRVKSLEEGQLSVYYPMSWKPQPNTVFSAQILGIMQGCQLLLRAGTFLFSLNMAYALGISPQLAGSVLKKAGEQGLLAKGKSVWVNCVRTDGRDVYSIGYADIETSTREVNLCFALDDTYGHGFLCQELSSDRYFWMPLSEVVHTEKAVAEVTYPILQKFSMKKPLTVCLTQYRTVSWLRGNANLEAKFKRLERRDTEHPTIVVVASQDISDTKRKHQYLCHERPFGNIYLLNSESERKVDDIVYTVCLDKTYHKTELVDKNEYRTAFRISRHLKAALQKAYPNEALVKAIIREQYIPQEDLSEAFRTGSAAADADVTVQILALCRQAIGQKAVDPNAPEAAELNDVIVRTLREYRANYQNGDEVPLLIAVAVCYLAERVRAKNDLYRYVMQYPENKTLGSCESILLKEWLLCEETHELYDLKRILDLLRLDGKTQHGTNSQYAGTLSQKQMSDIDMACGTILRRYKIKEDPARDAAMALQYLSAEHPQESYELTMAWKRTTVFQLFQKLGFSISNLEHPDTDKLFAVMLEEAESCYLALSERNATQFMKALSETLEDRKA